jgi:choice-of-anchor A domain-containing protein
LGSYSTSWLNYDVISFNNFTATTGDIEGRAAIRNSASVGNGWSVGYQLHSLSTDETEHYAMIVGNNFNFGSGAVYPDGTNVPYAGEMEGLFVGGTFTGPSYLSSLVNGNCGGTAGCLGSQFSALQSCYGGYQSAMSSHADNVQYNIQWSELTVTCNSVTDTTYYITLTPTQMSQYTYSVLNSCNPNARWVVNVGGSGNVNFSGGSFPVAASQLTYNVLGSGRTITVSGTNLNGNLLAPYNVVYQPSGVINGKVIAADITMSWQMNRAHCAN